MTDSSSLLSTAANCSKSLFSENRATRILLGITGSVAAIKCPEIILRLVHETDDAQRTHIKCVFTNAGKEFFQKSKEYNIEVWNEFQMICANQDLTGNVCVEFYEAQDEWLDRARSSTSQSDDNDTRRPAWNQIGDPVMHIELRDWADILLIAPLSAHTLAKISNGFCDDLLSCCVRAWDFGHGASGRPGKPVVLAPAMNTAMWEHPITALQLTTFCGFWKHSDNKVGKERAGNGVVVVPPTAKMLACGEVGVGALADVRDIIKAVMDNVGVGQYYQSCQVVR